MIECAGLSKMHGRGIYALRDLDLRIEKGEFLFLTGPSGAGKSTFVNLVPRFFDPREGAITVDGLDLRRAARDLMLASVTQ